MILRKGCYHTFQAQNHSLLGHDVEEEEVMVVVAHRGEKEIRSRERCQAGVAWYIQLLGCFLRKLQQKECRLGDGVGMAGWIFKKVSARSRWNVFGSCGILRLSSIVKVRKGYVISRTQSVAQGRPIGCKRLIMPLCISSP